MSGNQESVLSQLKYPLVFFGLSLLIVEAAFSTALASNNNTNEIVFYLSSWMGGLFLVSILIVAFLVYKVPTHIMLESQKVVSKSNKDLLALKDRLDRAADIISNSNNNNVNDLSGAITIINEVGEKLKSTEMDGHD